MNEIEDQEVEQEESTANEPDFIWDDGEVARVNYQALGQRLAESGDLFRNPSHGGGLVQLLTNGRTASITKAADLLPVIVDRVKVLVMKDGKVKGSRINAADLNAMLKSESFLNQFTTVDRLTPVPLYLPDFTLTVPGFNDGGPKNRILNT